MVLYLNILIKKCIVQYTKLITLILDGIDS